MSNLEGLKNELLAPIKSIRLFAIEKTMQMPGDQHLLSCLEYCLKTEEDPECQMLLRHSIQNLHRTLSQNKTTEMSLEEFEQAFNIAPAETQLSLLSQVKVSKIKGANCDVLVPKLLAIARNEVVAAALIKKFTRFWPESLRSYLEKNVFSRSKSLQIACIETLMKRFPESLKSQLHKIIHVKDPVIRSLAIWSMGRFFPELAADFIKDSLEKGDYYSKATALQICSTLDFNLIKQSILNLIFAESDARIFKAACTIVLNNPDKEIPFRLMEIITRSQKDKAKYLSAFLPLYCENLKAAKVCEDFTTYMQTLEIHSSNLKARIFVHNCLAAASSAELSEQQEAVKELNDKIKSNSFVRSAAYEYAETCQDDRLKNILTSLLKHEATQEHAQQIATGDSDQNTDQTSDSDYKLIKEFARARFRKNPETEKKAREILDLAEASDSLKLMAFKAAIHLGIQGLYEIARAYINSDDEHAVSAGLEYLEKFHKDAFHEATQKLIHTESIVIRNTLINATSRTNPEYAKFLITHLLTHRDKNKRRQGLASTVQIDFSYIYPELVAFLEREENVELIQTCLLIFMANPRIDAIYQMKLLKNAKGSIYWLFDEAEKDLSAIVQSSGIATEEEINAYFARQQLELQARRKAREQAKELVETQSKVDWSSVSEQLQVLSQINMKLLAPGIILLLLFVIFAIFNKAPTRVTRPQTRSRVARTAPKSQPTDLGALPDKGRQTVVKLLNYDAANKIWNVEDEEKIQYKVFIKDPEQFAEDQQLAITIQGSRYSLTGDVLIFVDSAEKLN